MHSHHYFKAKFLPMASIRIDGCHLLRVHDVIFIAKGGGRACTEVFGLLSQNTQVPYAKSTCHQLNCYKSRRWQTALNVTKHKWTLLLLLVELDEDSVTFYSGHGESRISRVYYKQHIWLSCSQCADESVSEVAAKESSWGLMGWIKTVRCLKCNAKSLLVTLEDSYT